jgi:hypothetical protein
MAGRDVETLVKKESLPEAIPRATLSNLPLMADYSLFFI